MKAVFGLVSLLIVLAVVGLMVSRQARVVALPDTAASATVPQASAREQPQPIQQQVRDDLQRALDQSQARRDEADK